MTLPGSYRFGWASFMEVGARALVITVVIGQFLMFGAAAADQLVSGDSRIQSAAAGDSSTDRQTYTRKAHADMREWQQKLHDFGEKADVGGQKIGHTTGDDLNKALADAEVASRRLQTASDEEWTDAKSSFEQASRELTATWDKIRPQDK
jgi:hypothetical protein